MFAGCYVFPTFFVAQFFTVHILNRNIKVSIAWSTSRILKQDSTEQTQI